jgi:phage terminase Nu1 subunit (DNA packaging protein)
MKMPLINVKQIAKLMNLTPRRVQQLAKEGLPREAKGKYDASKAMQFYIRYLQKALEQKATPDGDGKYTALTGERTRTMRADAELKEIQVAEKRRDLVAVSDVKKALLDLVHMTKARVLATPAQIAAEVTGETSRIIVQGKIDKKLKEALSHLADDGANYSPFRAN